MLKIIGFELIFGDFLTRFYQNVNTSVKNLERNLIQKIKQNFETII